MEYRTKSAGRAGNRLAPGRRGDYPQKNRMWSLLKEFFRFCLREKKWWLAPLIVLLLVLGVVIVVASSTPIATLIYSIF